MDYFMKKVKSLLRHWRRATTNLPKFPQGTKLPLMYRIRRLLIPNVYIPAKIISPCGASHYLSTDPLDDRVLEDILGALNYLFFPKISASVNDKLNNGGCILDVGAFNGAWGVEMLMKYPSAQAIFLEPNPEKCMTIIKTIKGSNLNSRAHLIPAGLAVTTGHAWLIKSEYGSWGDWLEYTEPPQPNKALVVSTVTLEKALNGADPTIVKCNAEGGEFELVRQVLILELRPRFIILMIHPEFGDVDQLWTSLSKAGYTIEVVRNSPNRPVWHAKWI